MVSYYPKPEDFYGKPGKPKAKCSRCKGLYYPEQLQIIRESPDKEIWLCPKCNFKYNLRRAISGR